MKLTTAERLIIRNQLFLMKELKVGGLSPSDYDEKIEIIESGYEVFYPDVLGGLSEHGTDRAVTDETMEIFDLYRALDTAKRNGLTMSGGTGHASFAGFDGNNDEHYGFARFLLDVQGSYAESAPMRNSHSSGTISTYRRMLSVWQSLGRSHTLSQADVNAILA